MKTYKKILLIVIALVIAINMGVTRPVYATGDATPKENEVTLKTSATEAKVGDVVKITISAKSTSDVGGVESILSWDKTKMDFKNKSSFPLSGEDEATKKFTLSLLCDDVAKEVDLGTLEFEIKDTAIAGEGLSIKISEVSIVDANTFETVNAEDKEVTITVIDGNGEGETEGGDTEPEPEPEPEPEDTKKEETNDKVDNTIADKNINYAGIERYAFILIVVIGIIAIVLYKKTKKYGEIK